jgi:hypothetical protein
LRSSGCAGSAFSGAMAGADEDCWRSVVAKTRLVDRTAWYRSVKSHGDYFMMWLGTGGGIPKVAEAQLQRSYDVEGLGLVSSSLSETLIFRIDYCFLHM